jgi:hypothetical protein
MDFLITNYSFVKDHIITVHLETNKRHIILIEVNTPKEGREEETRRCYKQPHKEVDKYSKGDSLIKSRDLNARVGNLPIPNIVRTFGEDCVNRNGQKLSEFHPLMISKLPTLFFRKKEILEYTWSKIKVTL